MWLGDGTAAEFLDPLRRVGLTAVEFTLHPHEAGWEDFPPLIALFDPATGTVDRICQMNFALGEWFAAAKGSVRQAVEIGKESGEG